MVITEVTGENPLEMLFVQDDHLIEHLATDTATDSAARYGWATRFSTLASSPPVLTTSSPLPGDHDAWLDERQGILPARPQTGQPGPERAIGQPEPWATDGLLVHGDLMPQRQVFQVQ
jgi:hypothetical protein